ncbi:MAG: antibiotic biosynthesis monooxygenase family protein [Pseudomonadota bacterium]
MFAVTVTFSIRLGQLEDFLEMLSAHARAVIEEEPSCRRAECFGDPARPSKAMLIQIFEDEAAFEAFRASDLAKAFDSKAVDIVTSRSIATWSEVTTAAPEGRGTSD